MCELRYVWESAAAEGGDGQAHSTCRHFGTLQKETDEASPSFYDGLDNKLPFSAARRAL